MKKGMDMNENKITIDVDEKTAFLYNNAPEYKKKSINFLLKEWLKENPDKPAISQLMDKIGYQAMSRGLTEEEFSKILDED